METGKKLQLDFEKRGGLVTVVVQDETTKEVLMLAYANEEAYLMTLETNVATFWSTSRNELWIKGATSGATMEMVELRVDCDNDALLYIVKPADGSCHTKNKDGGYRTSCFHKRLNSDGEIDLILEP